MMARECRYVPFSKQPLIFVLCQVRISPVRKIADYIPSIQEEFRRHGYPIERSGKIKQLNISQNGVQTIEQDLWEFRNKEEDWSIIVVQDSFTLQTTAYQKFEDFAKHLKLAANTILTKTEHNQYGVIHRIGLRYVDLVQPRDGEDFRYYIQSGFHGLSGQVFNNGTSRTLVECIGQISLDEILSTMVVRIAQSDQGTNLPPDLIGNAPKVKERTKRGELVTFIDMDHYAEGNFNPDTDWIEKITYLLHDKIIETFHEHVITKEAVEVWK
jgi:uncharacterized protein (TIGR04255 family)